MSLLYQSYKQFNKVKEKVQDYKNINLEIKDKGMLDKNTKIVQQVKFVQELYTDTFEHLKSLNR